MNTPSGLRAFAPGKKELAAHFCQHKKSHIFKSCFFPFDVGLLSRQAGGKGKPCDGTQPSVTERTGVGGSALGYPSRPP